jgi:hypothetical protein
MQNYEDDRTRWLHFHAPSYQFTPRRFDADPRAVIARDDFRPAMPLDSAAERYHPEYDFVTDIAHSQSAVLPRGDSMIVAAAMNLHRETHSSAAPYSTTFYLARSAAEIPVLIREHDVSETVRFTVTVPRENTLLGLEALSQRFQVAARTRHTVTAPVRSSGAWVTQPVLFAPTAAMPRRAADVLPRMLGSETLRRRDTVGLYWEVGGVARGTVAHFSLRAVRTGGRRAGVLERFVGIFRTDMARDTLTVSWSDPIGSDEGVSGHSLSISLSSLSEGQYRLELEVEFPGGVRVASDRGVEIVNEHGRAPNLLDALRQPMPKSESSEPEPAPRRRTGGGTRLQGQVLSLLVPRLNRDVRRSPPQDPLAHLRVHLLHNLPGHAEYN